MSDDLWQRRAVDLAAMLAAGEVSAREVLDAHVARIEAVNPAVNAIVTLAIMVHDGLFIHTDCWICL